MSLSGDTIGGRIGRSREHVCVDWRFRGAAEEWAVSLISLFCSAVAGQWIQANRGRRSRGSVCQLSTATKEHDGGVYSGNAAVALEIARAIAAREHL